MASGEARNYGTAGAAGTANNTTNGNDNINGTAVDNNTPSGRPSSKANTRALAPDLVRGLLMLLMAADHVVVMTHVHPHSTSDISESDSTPVHSWNIPLGYAVRTLSHLCGAGFPFLMGMGCVFLYHSRARVGWSASRLGRYLAVRSAVLALFIPVGMGMLMAPGRVWYLNMVLTALGVGYLLAGGICIAMGTTEGLLASLLASAARRAPGRAAGGNATGERESLLPREDNGKAAALSWHIHNVVLVALGVVTIWWNVWFSPTGGHCGVDVPSPTSSVLLRLWVYPVQEGGVVSVFPPLAWLSFSILGVVYGRILRARKWTQRALVAGYAGASVVFATMFVLTRLLRMGNLSEDCLRTAAHEAHPDMNPYLVSPKAFFYVVKYPPDVAYWGLTMSGVLALLGVFECVPHGAAERYLGILVDLGRSALAFYLVHLVVLTGMAGVVLRLFGRDTGVPDPMMPGGTVWVLGSEWAAGGVLVALVGFMWPFCRWYGRFKGGKPADSVWRLF